jgi:NAD(P)-dependent dehydrogenase (short-subunit alcohol dehydrogenase family)
MKEGLFTRPAQEYFDYELESINGKKILITGGTTGIGRATAILLAAQCAQVMIYGRHENELNDAMLDIN